MPAPPVASLLASATDIVCELGCAAQLVAISHECDHPLARGRDLPRVTRSRIHAESADAIDQQVKSLMQSGESLYELDEPLLEQLQPQWILTQGQCEVCAIALDEVRRFVRQSPTLQMSRILTLQAHSIYDVLHDVERISEKIEAPDTRMVTVLQKRVDAVIRRTQQEVGPRPTLACVEWLDPPMLSGNWVPEMIRLAGGEPVLAKDKGPSRYWSWDELIACDPEVIVLTPCGFELARILADLRVANLPPRLLETKAVRNGRIFAADGNVLFNRAGPELVTTLEWLGCLLHPRVHPRPSHDPRSQVVPLRWNENGHWAPSVAE